MIKRMVLTILLAGLVVGGVIGYKLFGRHMMAAALAAQKPPPVAVATATAQELDWDPSLHAVGTFVATQGIIVAAQLDGAVTQIAFEPGAAVEAGALLVQQDISTETAQLEAAEAAAALAASTLERAKALREHESNAQSDLDAASAAFREAQANAAAIRSVIAKKTIRAPFAGRVGIRQVNTGQFLRSGNPIVPLQALDPIFFNFSLPQQSAAQAAVSQKLTVGVDAFPGEGFAGEVTAINPNVDEGTRTLQLQATLANPTGRLQPGMYGSAEIHLPKAGHVITIPLAANVDTPYGDAVYLVEPGEGGALVARQQFVQTGAKRGDQAAILKGVAAGATVVTAGQLKLRNGAVVVVNNAVRPADSAAPRPDHP